MAYRLKLSDRLARQMEALPETGMGYHIVDITLNDGTILHHVVILNSEYLEVPDFDLKAEHIANVSLSSQSSGTA